MFDRYVIATSANELVNKSVNALAEKLVGMLADMRPKGISL